MSSDNDNHGYRMSTRGWRGVVADLERTGTARGRAALGYYSIEGLRLHERALRAGVRIDRVVVGETLRSGSDARLARVLEALDSAGCRIHTVPDEVVEELADGRKSGGLLGLVPLPPAPKLSEVVAGARRPTVLLVAVDVEDPGNVGALTRTALAGFATALVAVGISDPYHPRALRTSMGSVFKLPILIRPTLPGVLAELADAGFVTLGAVSTGATGLAAANLAPERLAVLMGSEAFGLAAEVQSTLDERVTIPMAPGVDSFSVNAAAAILLHEIHRRRLPGTAP